MNDSPSTGNIGLPTILFVVFLVLKLCGVIAWSWVWIFAPLWISFLLVAFIFLVIILMRPSRPPHVRSNFGRRL